MFPVSEAKGVEGEYAIPKTYQPDGHRGLLCCQIGFEGDEPAPMPAAIARAASVGGRFGFGLQGRLVAKAARTTFSKASVCSDKRATRPYPRDTLR